MIAKIHSFLENLLLAQKSDLSFIRDGEVDGFCAPINIVLTDAELQAIIETAMFIFKDRLEKKLADVDFRPEDQMHTSFYFKAGMYEEGDLLRVLPRDIIFVVPESSDRPIELVFLRGEWGAPSARLAFAAFQQEAQIQDDHVEAFLKTQSKNTIFLSQTFFHEKRKEAYAAYYLDVSSNLIKRNIDNVTEVLSVRNSFYDFFRSEGRNIDFPSNVSMVEPDAIPLAISMTLQTQEVPVCSRLPETSFPSTITKVGLSGCRIDQLHLGKISSKFVQAVSKTNYPVFAENIRIGTRMLRELAVGSAFFLHTDLTDEVEMEGDKKILIVADYFKNGSLAHFLSERPDLSLKDKEAIAHQILSAVEYMHATGQNHNDLKTENILVDNSENIVIFDADTASRPGSDDASCLSEGGTHMNYPPELIACFYKNFTDRNIISADSFFNPDSSLIQWVRTNQLRILERDFNIPTDITSDQKVEFFYANFEQNSREFETTQAQECWAVGLVLYRLFTGVNFIAQVNPFELTPFTGLPPAFQALLQGLLEYDDENRWPAGCALEMLSQIISVNSIHTPVRTFTPTRELYAIDLQSRGASNAESEPHIEASYAVLDQAKSKNL